jgi:hypothetical protein
MNISELLALIDSYVGGADQNLFRERLMNAYAGLSPSNPEDEEALNLCRLAEWELADFSEGLIDENALRNALRETLSQFLLRPQSDVVRAFSFGAVMDEPFQVITGTSSHSLSRVERRQQPQFHVELLGVSS